MNWNQALFPSLQRRGGCAIKKMSRSNLSSRHPVCGARAAQARQRAASIEVASRLFINAAATPPLQGGECVRTETVCQFIHTFSALGYDLVAAARLRAREPL